MNPSTLDWARCGLGLLIRSLQLGIQACGRTFVWTPKHTNITLTPREAPPTAKSKEVPSPNPRSGAIFPGRKSRRGSRALPNSLPWSSSPAPFGKGKCQAWQGDGWGMGRAGAQG